MAISRVNAKAAKGSTNKATNKLTASKLSKTASKGKTSKKLTSKTTTKTSKPAGKTKTAAKATKKPVAAKPVKAAKVAIVKVEPKKPVPQPPKKPTLVNPKNSTSRQYTQSELFDCIQGYCGFSTRREAREFYENFSDMIRTALKSGFKLVLPGLGKIQVRKTKARKGINPATREPITIPARKKVAFTPIKALKQAVL